MSPEQEKGVAELMKAFARRTGLAPDGRQTGIPALLLRFRTPARDVLRTPTTSVCR